MSPKAVLRPLMLASTSRYRAGLLGRFGLPFNTASPAVDEAEIAGEAPRARALRLSEAKAEAVAAQYPEAVVIGGDQVTAARGRILHKPGNASQCREQLRLQSGSSAEFFTACTVRCLATQLMLSHVDATTVTLRALGEAEIDRYVEREQAFDCAGGFKAEALGITLFERMESQDPTAIVGLPLIWLAGALRTAGFSLP
jgi:7-methyl-GTP pyrophosphatase